MPKTLLRSLAFSCALLQATEVVAAAPASAPALAKTCSKDDPDACAQPLRLGEPAPFSGQLLTTRLAIQLGQKADGCTERTRIELDFQKQTMQLDIDLQKQLRAIDAQGAAAAQKSLEAALADARKPPPIIERPWFVATVTSAIVLSVIGATLAVAVKVIEVRKTP